MQKRVQVPVGDNIIINSFFSSVYYKIMTSLLQHYIIVIVVVIIKLIWVDCKKILLDDIAIISYFIYTLALALANFFSAFEFRQCYLCCRWFRLFCHSLKCLIRSLTTGNSWCTWNKSIKLFIRVNTNICLYITFQWCMRHVYVWATRQFTHFAPALSTVMKLASAADGI